MPWTVNGVSYQYRRPLYANTVGIAAAVTDVLPFVGPDLTGKALASLNDVVLTEADGITLLGSPSANKYAGAFEVKTIAAPVGHGKFTLTAGEAAYLAAYLYYNATGGDPGDQTDIATPLTGLSYAGYWPLSDAASPAVDWTGNGNNGVQSGGVTFGATGQVGQCCDFERDSLQYLNLGSGSSLAFLGSLTVGVWYKPETDSGWTALVCRLNSNDGRGWGLVHTGTNVLLVHGSNVWYEQPCSLVVGTWVHIAATKAVGTQRIFVNGVQVGTSGTSTSPQYDGNVNGALGRYNPALAAYHPDGLLDLGIAVGAELTPSQMLAQYRAGAGTLWSWGAEEQAGGLYLPKRYGVEGLLHGAGGLAPKRYGLQGVA